LLSLLWLRLRRRIARLRAAEALSLPLPPLGLCGYVPVLRGRTRVGAPWVVCQDPDRHGVWRCLEEQLRRTIVLDSTGHEDLGHGRRRYREEDPQEAEELATHEQRHQHPNL